MANQASNDTDKIYTALITPYHCVATVGQHKIYLGNQSFAGGFPDYWNYTPTDLESVKATMKKIGITAIVCCADNVEIFPNDFAYLQIPMQNNTSFPIEKSVTKAYDFITEHIATGSIFVHCNAGCTRSPSVVLYFLMKHNGWTFQRAYDYLYDIRSCIDVEIFKNQLVDLQH